MAIRSVAGSIRVGVGGWTYEPWRETFYPADVPKARELHYASRALTAIEVNGTFYRTQKPETYVKWRDETPEGFMFSLKAPRYATQRKVLAEAGSSIQRFIDSGISELGAKLGPLLWQIDPRHKFEPEDLDRFLSLLPKQHRNVLEVRHESFMCTEFVSLVRSHRVATVFADTDEYPSFADITADFVYGRLMRCASSCETGYAADQLDRWATNARTWSSGGEPRDVKKLDPSPAKKTPRDVFLFFISGAKERAPGAARALISRLNA